MLLVYSTWSRFLFWYGKLHCSMQHMARWRIKLCTLHICELCVPISYVSISQKLEKKWLQNISVGHFVTFSIFQKFQKAPNGNFVKIIVGLTFFGLKWRLALSTTYKWEMWSRFPATDFTQKTANWKAWMPFIGSNLYVKLQKLHPTPYGQDPKNI